MEARRWTSCALKPLWQDELEIQAQIKAEQARRPVDVAVEDTSGGLSMTGRPVSRP